MIKKLLSLACFAVLTGNAQTTNFSLYYSFSSVTGTANPVTVDPTPAPTTTGVTSGSWTAVGTGTGSTAPGVFSFVNWPNGSTSGNNSSFSGSLNPNVYYEMVITPQTSYAVTLTDMTFGATRSGTGVRHWAVRTNKDNYSVNTAASYTPLGLAATNSVTPITIQGGNTFFWTDDAVTGSPAFATYNICQALFNGPQYANQATPFNIRIYAWDAEGTAGTGTFRIDTVRINGSATYSVGVGLPKLTHDINVKFRLYPNPTNDGIAVLEATQASVTKIEVINLLGAVVASQNVAIQEEKIKLDLTTLATGTYFVRVSGPSGISTEKLVISK